MFRLYIFLGTSIYFYELKNVLFALGLISQSYIIGKQLVMAKFLNVDL